MRTLEQKNWNRSFSIMFISIFILSSSQAADRPDYSFKTVVEKNAPLRIVWKDGREAEIKRASSPLLVIKIPIQVTENSCAPVIPKECFMEYPIKVSFFDALWTKNPNPERVGKSVVSNFGTPEMPSLSSIFRDFQTSDAASASIDRRFEKLDRPLRFTCDRVDWVPFDQNSNAQLSSWLTQSMTTNPETGQDENVLNTTFTQTQLKKATDTSFEVVSFGYSSLPSYSAGLFLGGQFLIWNMTSAKGTCSTQISLNLSFINQPEYRVFLDRKPLKEWPFETYVFEPKGLIQDAPYKIESALTNSYFSDGFDSEGNPQRTMTYGTERGAL